MDNPLMDISIETVVVNAFREGIPVAQIARIVHMPIDDIMPFVPEDVAGPELMMAMARCMKTTPGESKLLYSLLTSGTVSRERVAEIVGVASGDVLLCKLRNKLRFWGLGIATVGGVGYQMSPDDRVKAQAIISGEGP